MALADSLTVMSEGYFLQIGDPKNLYRRPVNQRAAEFLGRTNWIVGTIEGSDRVRMGLGALTIPSCERFAAGDAVSLGIRPKWVDFKAGMNDAGVVAGQVVCRAFLGESVVYQVSVRSNTLIR